MVIAVTHPSDERWKNLQKIGNLTLRAISNPNIKLVSLSYQKSYFLPAKKGQHVVIEKITGKTMDTTDGNVIADKTSEDAPIDANQEQFEIELEFVQCLASPSYLNFLAQNEYLDKPEFLDYIEYLQYWRTPQYVRFIVFPHALYFLRMLREDAFREAIKRGDYTLMLHQQQGYYWQFARTMKEHVPPPLGQNAQPPARGAEGAQSAGV